jgi:phosphoglycolate phosphatase-like HAD superfamily hydrolase
MGISKGTYRQIKLAYRQGGMIRSMPCFEGAQDLINGLRKAGLAVWICTTRPYLRLDNMATDTTHWLKRNHIKADGLIASDYKYHDLVKAVGRESVVAVLDDLPEMCDQANRAGIESVLMTRSHNEPAPWDGVRASSLKEALDLLIEMR